MLNITQEVVFYIIKANNSFFLILISNLFGWNLIKLKTNCILLKKKIFFKLYGIFLLKSFLGYYKNFMQYLKLKGMGYKTTINGCSLVFKLSQSHRLVYKIQRNIKITFLHKQALIFKSKSLHLLKKILFFLQKFGKKNAYKKKGIFLKGMIISVKINSKKSKF